MKKKSLILALALLLAGGCEQYWEMDAMFVVHNMSNKPITITVNGLVAFEGLPPQRTEQFPVKITAPRARNPNPTGPGPSELDLNVSVGVRTMNPDLLVSERSCRAGERLITYVWYEVNSRDEGRIRCDAGYSR